MNTIETRGKLPPGVMKPREGYRETEAQLISEECAVYDNDYPTGTGESKALRYLYRVDAELAKQSRKERERIAEVKRQQIRERREQAKRERISEYFDWACVVMLCAEIAAAVLL